MKTLILIIVGLIIGLLKSQAQTTIEEYTEKVQETCNTPKKVSCDYYRSYAFLDLENKFSIKLRFMDEFLPEVTSYLMDQFGEENVIKQEKTLLWKKEFDGENLYEVKLKGNKLRICFNKEYASKEQIYRFETIGKELKTITSSSQPEK